MIRVNRHALHATWAGSYRDEARFRRRLALVGFLLIVSSLMLLGVFYR
jgi:hypothetical protein